MSNTKRQIARAWALAVALASVFATMHAKAAACDMQLSENTVDYGRLNRSELDMSSVPGNDVLLGKRKLILNIACEQPTTMALRFNASPAQGGGYVFAGTGNLTVLMSNAMVDGNPVALAKTDASGRSIQGVATSQYLESGYGVAAVVGGALFKGKRFVASLDIQPSMPRAAMRVRGETRWEGLGQLELLP